MTELQEPWVVVNEEVARCIVGSRVYLVRRQKDGWDWSVDTCGARVALSAAGPARTLYEGQRLAEAWNGRLQHALKTVWSDELPK